MVVLVPDEKHLKTLMLLIIGQELHKGLKTYLSVSSEAEEEEANHHEDLDIQWRLKTKKI